MGLPLVGRDEVLADVERHQASCGGAVVVYGAAGVGKTRLAREILGRAEARGMDTSWSVASRASASVPFAALSELLTVGGGTDPPGMALHAWRRHLEERAQRAPLLIGIDDAHLLDAASLALVHALRTVPHVSLVLTVRAGEPVPEEVSGLWKDSEALRVDVGPLERAGSDRLVVAVLGGPVDSETLTMLWRSARGNPLFLRELLLEARQQEQLVQRGERWTLVGRPSLSRRLTELVTAHLGSMSGAARRGLEALTLVEPLGFGPLLQLVGADAAEELERSGMIEFVDDHRRRQVRFAQDLYSEVVRTTILHSRTVAVSEELLKLLGADAAEPMSTDGARRRGDLLLLAELWRHTGRPGGGELFLAAAREAMGLGAHGRAVSLAELAVDRAGGFAARATYGEALTYLGQTEHAEQVLAHASGDAQTEPEILQAALLRFHNQLFNGGDPLEAERIVTGARQQVATQDGGDQLDAALAMSATLRGDLPRALAVSAGVLHRADPDERTLLGALVLTSVCRALLGDVGDALRDVRRAQQLLDPMREQLPLAAHQIGITEVLALWHDARGTEALARARDGYHNSLDGQAMEATGTWATAVGLVLAEGGRFGEATEFCREAAARLEAGDPLGLRGTALAIHARCAAALGESATARSLLDELTRLGSEDLRTVIHTDRARVWLAAADGEVAHAADLAFERGQRAIASTHLSWGAMLLHDAVRFGHPRPAIDVLERLADGHDAYLLRLQADHAKALADADPAALGDVATAFSAHDLPLYAAESMAQAAELLRRQGEAAAVRRATALAESLVPPSDAVTAPALLRISDPLTARERDVALLARNGATSRQIGAHFDLSVRTVDNYLASVYRKTGIEGRHRLGLVLGPPPSPTAGS